MHPNFRFLKPSPATTWPDDHSGQRPTRERVRLPLLGRLRLAVSAAIVALAVMGSLVVAGHVPGLAARRELVLLGCILLGVGLWIAGAFKHVADDDEESPFRFLGNLRYLAVMTLLVGLLFFVLTQSPPPPPAPAPVKAAAPPAPPPREFPPLKLQGIVLQGGASQALIDNRLLSLGDMLESGVQVVEISSNKVTVALDGQTMVLTLP
jgi:hypothetical protein